MAFLGTLLGGTLGFAIGGPIGALIGAGGGHLFDRFRESERRTLAGPNAGVTGNQAEAQVAFAVGLIGLSAKVAKADGRVTPDEIRAFRRVFHFPSRDEARVAAIYNEARQSSDGFEQYAQQLAAILGSRDERCAQILDCLFTIAAADGVFHPNEDRIIREIGHIFGFSDSEMASIRARHQGTAGPGSQGAADASNYEVLGVAPTASDDEIKSAHRGLVRKFHPDHLVSKGLPDELIEHATERLAAINSAYEAIMKSRPRK